MSQGVVTLIAAWECLVRSQVENISSTIHDDVKLNPNSYRVLSFELVCCYCNSLGYQESVTFHTFLLSLSCDLLIRLKTMCNINSPCHSHILAFAMLWSHVSEDVQSYS